MGDEDDLGEAVGQAPQQVDHRGAPVLVERAEDLVQDEQRERLAGALRDHLADGEPERQVGDVLLAAGDDRLGIAVVEQRGAVVLVELEVGVAAVGEVAQEAGGEVGEIGTQRGVEIGAQIGERAVELLVQRELGAGGRDLALPLARSARRRATASTASAAAADSPRARTSVSSASRRARSAAASGLAGLAVGRLAVAERRRAGRRSSPAR